MKSFVQHLEELKMPGEQSGIGVGPMLRRAVDPTARDRFDRLKKAMKTRKSPKRKRDVEMRQKETNPFLKTTVPSWRERSGQKDINTPWTTTTNAAT